MLLNVMMQKNIIFVKTTQPTRFPDESCSRALVAHLKVHSATGVRKERCAHNSLAFKVRVPYDPATWLSTETRGHMFDKVVPMQWMTSLHSVRGDREISGECA